MTVTSTKVQHTRKHTPQKRKDTRTEYTHRTPTHQAENKIDQPTVSNSCGSNKCTLEVQEGSNETIERNFQCETTKQCNNHNQAMQFSEEPSKQWSNVHTDRCASHTGTSRTEAQQQSTHKKSAQSTHTGTETHNSQTHMQPTQLPALAQSLALPLKNCRVHSSRSCARKHMPHILHSSSHTRMDTKAK